MTSTVVKVPAVMRDNVANYDQLLMNARNEGDVEIGQALTVPESAAPISPVPNGPRRSGPTFFEVSCQLNSDTSSVPPLAEFKARWLWLRFPIFDVDF